MPNKLRLNVYGELAAVLSFTKLANNFLTIGDCDEFLSKIKNRADSYIIYAETCAVAEEFLQRYKIEFRKIPRDILKI